MYALVLEGPVDGQMLSVKDFGNTFSDVEKPTVASIIDSPDYDSYPITTIKRYDYKLQTVRSVHEEQMREHYFYTLKTMSAAEVIQHLITRYAKEHHENR